ncbi:MAG: response regulator [Spirochaetales bacterium]|jgi:DNA-binding response OmpR family regulator|nr:response regulator [Spirochaetales bacterium]
MKKILVIDESPLFRNFLRGKFEAFGFEVALAVNGLEGSLKLRSFLPDLIITDYVLSRKSCMEFLREKKSNPNTANTPVIMVSNPIDRNRLIEIAKYGVKKFFTKPLKIDAFVKTVSEILQVNLSLDSAPCIISAHFNDEVFIIEVAMGLNSEKIDLLRFKLTELLDLYEVKEPKVLVIMSSIDITANDSLKLGSFLSVVVEYSRAKPKFVKILTTCEYIRQYVEGRSDFSEIDVTSSLEHAMDGLLGRKTGSYIKGDNMGLQEEFLSAAAPRKEADEEIQMRFAQETPAVSTLADAAANMCIAVVDDDLVIQEFIKTAFIDTGFTVDTYNNGDEYLKSGKEGNYDLIFLDLMMPVLDGFETLRAMALRGIKKPVIVLSALSKQETVIKALQLGVRSYLIKPLKPEEIRKKTTEILHANF